MEMTDSQYIKAVAKDFARQAAICINQKAIQDHILRLESIANKLERLENEPK